MSLEFQVQLYINALKELIASRTLPENPLQYRAADDVWRWARHQTLEYREYGVEQAGYVPGVCMNVSHVRLDQFLAEQVKLYFETISGTGTGDRSADFGPVRRPMIIPSPLAFVSSFSSFSTEEQEETEEARLELVV